MLFLFLQQFFAGFVNVARADSQDARLSFAPEEQLWELLHCTGGSASILGLMNDSEARVQLLLERETCEAEYFACHPCDNTQSLKFKTEDLLNVLLPKLGHEPIIVEL